MVFELYDCLLLRLARFIYNDLNQVLEAISMQWIDAMKERPVANEAVVVHTPLGIFVATTGYNDDEDWMTNEGRWLTKEQVQYWHPLPPIPPDEIDRA